MVVRSEGSFASLIDSNTINCNDGMKPGSSYIDQDFVICTDYKIHAGWKRPALKLWFTLIYIHNFHLLYYSVHMYMYVCTVLLTAQLTNYNCLLISNTQLILKKVELYKRIIFIFLPHWTLTQSDK